MTDNTNAYYGCHNVGVKIHNHRIPKEMECFGSAYLETDEICILCRSSEDCSKWCSRNNRNTVLDDFYLNIISDQKLMKVAYDNYSRVMERILEIKEELRGAGKP